MAARQTIALPSWFLTKEGYWLYSRLIRPDDAPRLIALFDQLSSETRRLRFHANMDHLEPEVKVAHAQVLAGVDNGAGGGAVVAVDHQRGQQVLVGVLRLGPVRAGQSEVAVVVRDDFQGRGVGYALLQRLLPLAQQMQVQTVTATIQAENLPALRLFRRLNYPLQAQTSHAYTELQIHMPIAPLPRTDPA
jgi:acetyltransferase